MKNSFALFIFTSAFFVSPIKAQFSGYEENVSSGLGAGLYSEGVGLRNALANSSGNPALLAYNKSSLVSFGLLANQQKQSNLAYQFNGSAYYQWNASMGFGVRARPMYSRSFPTEEKLQAYQGQVFLSYALNDSIFLSFGIGPSLASRVGGISSYSLSAYASVGIVYDKFTFGISLESPGSFRMDSFLGSERLRERLPERVSLGVQYDLNEYVFLYSELRRVIWERAYFRLNGIEEKPDYPSLTMFTGSFGLGWKYSSSSQILFGLANNTRATQSSGLQKMYGASIGYATELFPDAFGKGIFFNCFFQQNQIRGSEPPIEVERTLGLQLVYVLPSVQSLDNDMSK
ncbi:hypothetical protein LPTSP4_06680 [Leptospira ryugenii]|uniref:Transporter, Ompp1/FadL/TodX domain protein n=1 Tax=Leptospira ryugenii TaxID=1917863 RepID=A0A2P2DWZ4_9LEPT|nr:hypothetical protein [Leptospira ryugenii]GBF49158.1 hypothetical protein LPTSP4_06680 [Leptospira ryugenii]